MASTELAAAFAALGVSSFSSSGWASTACPRCPAESSISLRVCTSGAYRCHRCNASSSSGVSLVEFVNNPAGAAIAPVSANGLPELTTSLVDRMSALLADSRGVLIDLERVRGWAASTCKALNIGWDGSRIWIPIYDYATGALLNARMYDPFKRNEIKSLHYANPAPGMTRTTVYVPGGSLDSDTVWLFEGEPDTILAYQLGLPAACVTGGAGTWTNALASVIETRKVVICADQDPAGERGARSWLQRLRSLGIEAVHLRFDTSGKDFTDAIMKDGKTAQFFKDLATAAFSGTKPTGSYSDQATIVPVGGGVPGELVEMRAHVIGGDIIPAIVPTGGSITCRINWKPESTCTTCPVGRARGSLAVAVDTTSQDILQLAVTPQRGHYKALAESSGVPGRCPSWRVNVTEYANVNQLRIIPPMLERHGGDSAVRVACHVTAADGRVPELPANSVVRLTGKIRVDPKTNSWLMAASDAVPTEDGIDSFRLTPDIEDAFKTSFSPARWTLDGVRDVIARETASLARHVTRVYGRDRILELVDITYHSVVRFEFCGRLVTRGWLSALVIGETRTGKSETASAFVNHIGIGRMIMDPANMTFAGLVGGVQQVGTGDKTWSITWGVVPVNDRGLVVLDELSSMSVEDISRMSGMRSSGIAEITKIRSQNTPARTRLIMMGNPRGAGRTLTSFPTPVESVIDLIGAPEDIARFDLAAAVLGGFDKNAADAALGPQPQPVPSEIRRDLVRFAWSRSPSSVKFDEDGERAVLDAAKRMVEKYDSAVPLVEPSEQELRIARVAVAAAVRTFSVVDGVVVVRRCHAEYAEWFMCQLLDGDMQYDAFSESKRRRRLNLDEAAAAMSKVSDDFRRLAQAFLRIKRVTMNSLSLSTGLDTNETRSIISALHGAGALDFTEVDNRSAYMVWTPEFLKALRAIETGELVLSVKPVDF